MKLLSLLSFAVLATAQWSFGAGQLVLRTTIPLTNVQGRIDHLAYDELGQRLFVAALGNNTVEVIDLKSEKVVRSLSGFSEPQGVLYVTDTQRLYVANGGDGTVRVWDVAAEKEVTRIQVGDDADNLRYDPANKEIYVGYGSGALGIIDPNGPKLTGTIPLHGHPEAFQLERSGEKIFVNVPGSRHVAVVDRTRNTEVGSWRLGFAAANFPMALDEQHHRLFIGCRLPARMLVFNTETGTEVAKLDLHGDTDDLFYDSNSGRVFASCGEGFIDIFQQDGPDRYVALPSVKTEAKARTSLWSSGTLFLAVPQGSGHEAHISVYAADSRKP